MFNKQDISTLHNTKRKFLNTLLSQLKDYNYDHYSTRIKTNDSICNKLRRKGYSTTPQNAMLHLSDIIGIRIVTQYINDVYDIVHCIQKHYDIKEECDYIANPKSSGYRSYHIIISVPIYNFQYGPDINIEIQIRTMGMDFWASLEHSLVYDKKKNVKAHLTNNTNLSLTYNELKNYAEAVFSIDMRLQALQHITEHEHPEHV